MNNSKNISLGDSEHGKCFPQPPIRFSIFSRQQRFHLRCGSGPHTTVSIAMTQLTAPECLLHISHNLLLKFRK